MSRRNRKVDPVTTLLCGVIVLVFGVSVAFGNVPEAREDHAADGPAPAGQLS